MPPGPPVISTLLSEVYGPDAQTRRDVANKIKAQMAKIPYIVDIDDYYGVPRPKTFFAPNRAQMDALGINEGQVLQSIGATFGGASLGTLAGTNGHDPIEISLRLPTQDRTWNARTSSMPVAISQTPVGARLVDMGELVIPQNTQSSYPIFRRDGREAEMVTADLAGQYEAPIYGIFDTNNKIKNMDWGNLPKPTISWHGQPPVSYTHLDVYKRQSQNLHHVGMMHHYLNLPKISKPNLPKLMMSEQFSWLAVVQMNYKYRRILRN